MPGVSKCLTRAAQWIHKILRECAPGRIVDPQPNEVQVRNYAIQAGHAYPTVYLSRKDLERVALPPCTRKFVVIRDLRDTLVSAYLSFKTSHPILTSHNVEVREILNSLDVEKGLLYLLDNFLSQCAEIQLSWLESDELVLRYEDLLEADVALLTDALIYRCGLPVDSEQLEKIILGSRFAMMSGGRPRGQEDRSAHERKGIAGDWRNHFTGSVKKAFKARFGGLLVASGYEQNLAW